MATLLYARTIPRIVRMFEMIDLMLSRRKYKNAVLYLKRIWMILVLIGSKPPEIFGSCWLFKVELQEPQPM
jgi:hypothetical protein